MYYSIACGHLHLNINVVNYMQCSFLTLHDKKEPYAIMLFKSSLNLLKPKVYDMT